MKNLSARPVVPVIVCYPQGKITIGAWAILQQSEHHAFVFFVKPKTRSYDRIKLMMDIEVYFDKDYKKWAKSNDDKLKYQPKTLFLTASVTSIFQIGEHKLVYCPVKQMKELTEFTVLAYQKEFHINLKEELTEQWKRYFKIG